MKRNKTSMDDNHFELYRLELKLAMNQLMSAWGRCNELFLDSRFDCNDFIVDNYPFDKSFDEIPVRKWCESVIDRLDEITPSLAAQLEFIEHQKFLASGDLGTENQSIFQIQMVDNDGNKSLIKDVFESPLVFNSATAAEAFIKRAWRRYEGFRLEVVAKEPSTNELKPQRKTKVEREETL